MHLLANSTLPINKERPQKTKDGDKGERNHVVW